jgi:probable phosphomutase (TIGR03848 family)
MATVILVRHARSEANASGTLAGRLPGVALDALGREQVRGLGERCAGVSLAAVVSSPIHRCVETAAGLGPQGLPPALLVDEAITECDYGDWQGRAIHELRTDPLWDVIQRQPSQATFPGGESLSAMQERAVEAVRRHDAAIAREHGNSAVWAMVSHGDVIKSVLADALGTGLDDFQRIHVDPASVSVVTYTPERPMVWCLNTREGSLGWLDSAAQGSGEAQPGGGDDHRPDASDPRGAGA